MIDDVPATSDGVAPDGEPIDGWPAELRGVTESVVATLGPNGRWNQAALGLYAADGEQTEPSGVTAKTWGRTRTLRNFEDRGEGYVQFTGDSVDFVEAALGVFETDEPVLASADAWIEVDVERVDAGNDGDTEWIEWVLDPRDGAIRNRVVPTTNRARGAVIEATVDASRLDVPGYETDEQLRRLEHYADVVDVCGGPRERAAFGRIDDLVGWRNRQ